MQKKREMDFKSFQAAIPMCHERALQTVQSLKLPLKMLGLFADGPFKGSFNFRIKGFGKNDDFSEITVAVLPEWQKNPEDPISFETILKQGSELVYPEHLGYDNGKSFNSVKDLTKELLILSILSPLDREEIKETPFIRKIMLELESPSFVDSDDTEFDKVEFIIDKLMDDDDWQAIIPDLERFDLQDKLSEEQDKFSEAQDKLSEVLIKMKIYSDRYSDSVKDFESLA